MRDEAGAMKRVLFVCVENAGRSQMAEAFARALGGARVLAASAGSRPSGRLNERVVAMMRERGHDLSAHRSKSVESACAEAGNPTWDRVVTMGCGDDCPWVPAHSREDWPLADPKHLDAAGVKAVGDEIESRVRALLNELNINAESERNA
jgi:arsenate reductase